MAHLETLGVPRATTASRCRKGGPWQRLLPGVVLLSSGTPTQAQLRQAALLYAGDGALLTGAHALDLHGLAQSLPARHLHVLIPATRRRTGAGRVIIERTHRVPQPVLRAGFPVAPVPRAVLDLGRRLAGHDQVRAIMAEAVQRGRCSAGELRFELDAGSSRGTSVPRLVLQEIADNVHSVAEAHARRLVRRSGLPAPRWNVPLVADGVVIAVVDAWFDEVGLAWEIDSYEYHLSPSSYATTLARHAVLTAHGVVVLHTLPSRLHRERRRVLDELCGSYEQAARRPRPSLIAQTA